MGPWTLVVVHLSALLGLGLSNMTGVGAALVLVPVLTLSVGAPVAVAVVAPVLLINSVVKAWVFRDHVERAALGWLMLGAVPTVVWGALATASIPETVLRRILGAVMLGFVVLQVVAPGSTRTRGRWGQLLWGAVTGAASGLTSAGGPTTSLALQAAGLSKEALVGTGAVAGILLQLVKVPIYAHTGLLAAEHVPLVLTLSGCGALAGLWGRRALGRMEKQRFEWMLRATLAVLGVVMLLR